MEFSAWKIWLHPQMAGRVLADYENRLDELLTEIGSNKAEIERLLKEKEEAVELAARLEEDNRELGKQLKETREKLEKADEELSDRKEAEEQIAEFESVLTRVEEMKRRYEQRIASLRHIVEDMKKASGEKNPEAMELKEISLDSGREVHRQPKRTEKPVKEKRESDLNWLEPLPD